jgi:hypothetical protein
VLGFVAEIVLQVAFEWLAEFGFRALREPFKGARQASPALAVAGYAAFGAAAGGLSLLMFPTSFIGPRSARIANLLITPVAAGALMSALGAWRRSRGQELIRLDRFAYGMVFAFAMSAVRFVFADHP